MKPKEIKIDGVTYVPKQEEQNELVLSIRVENVLPRKCMVEAHGTTSDILAAWSDVSCSLLDRIGVDLSSAFAALMAAKVILHNRSEG